MSTTKPRTPETWGARWGSLMTCLSFCAVLAPTSYARSRCRCWGCCYSCCCCCCSYCCCRRCCCFDVSVAFVSVAVVVGCCCGTSYRALATVLPLVFSIALDLAIPLVLAVDFSITLALAFATECHGVAITCVSVNAASAKMITDDMEHYIYGRDFVFAYIYIYIYERYTHIYGERERERRCLCRRFFF